MGKPFQFSMRQMFAAVLLLAIAFRLLVLFVAMRFDSEVLPVLLYFGIFIVGGAAFGCLERKPLTGALFGAFCGLILGFLVFLLVPAFSPVRE